MIKTECDKCKLVNNSNIDTLLLAGGKGTRLKQNKAANLPKPLVHIRCNGQSIPMIENAISGISHGLRSNLIVLTSKDPDSQSSMVENYIHRTHTCTQISFSIEDQPLGTAGAVNNALAVRGTSMGIISPCDTLFPFHMLKDIVTKHNQKKSRITWAVTSTPGQDAQNTGKVLIDKTGRVIYDLEADDKTTTKSDIKSLFRTTSVGVVVVDREYFVDQFRIHFSHTSPIPVDLYRQFIPKLLEIGEKVDTFNIHQPAPDLGTIERLHKFGNS